MKKIAAIIQSSWKSDFFPYKSLHRLSNDLTVLEIIVKSIKKMDVISDIVLATSDREEDTPLRAEAHRLGIQCYSGDLTNVLQRLQRAAELVKAESILKIDGNKPLFDRFEAEKLVHCHFEENADYSFNGHYNGVIAGTDCEVLNTHLFSLVPFDKLTPSQLESGTLYFRANPQRFKSFAKNFSTPRPLYRVSLDLAIDAEVLNNIVENVATLTNDAMIEYLDGNPIVARHNRLQKHKEIGLNKIMLFPEKLAALQKVQPNQPDLSYPISVELSLTNRCNFKCVWCSDLALRENQGAGDISIETLTRLAKDLAKHGTKGITIEGGGEPTVVKNFDEVCDVFKAEGLALGLITNGSRKLNESTVKKFEWIRVSLDASCQEEMATLKGYSNFERVIENIIFYAEHCPTVGIGYVATNQNTSQIEPLILRLRETKISYIQFRPVVDHPDLLPRYDFDYLQKYQTLSFAVITDGMKENVIKQNAGLPCTAHSLSSIITANGDVFICGRLNIHNWVKPLGNVNTQSFQEVWAGVERQKQTNMVLEKQFCTQHCPECRLTKFNIEFDRLRKIQTNNFI